MHEFIKVQYRLYLSGQKSIGIDKIKRLANLYLTKAECDKLFGTGGDA